MMIITNRMIITSIAGLLLTTTGILYVAYVDALLQYTLKWLMVLQPNSMITNLWTNPTLKITLDLYIFNWTNPEDFHDHSIKPKFEELGPYRFIDKSVKSDLKWHPENHTVSYLKKGHYYFDREASAGNLSENIIAPNVLASSLYNKIRRWSPMKRSLLDIAIKMYGNEMTMVRTIDEWMFKGFETSLMRLKKMVPINIPDLELPYENIGYAYPRNESTEVYGHHNVYTGADDFRKLGQIAKWRYSSDSVTFPHCGQVKGSTGEFHPLPLAKNKSILFFVPDLCRELEVDYAGTATVQGMDGYLYEGSMRNLANGTDNPSNRCYCPPEDCVEVPSGLMNISNCWFNTPVFVSYPHYYNADPYYVNQVEGMKPNKTRHGFSVVLDPTTGFIIDLKGRLMLSLFVEPVSYSSIFRNARRTFFPLIWADYSMQISPELAFTLKLIGLFKIIGRIMGVLFTAVGMVLIAWYPSKIYWRPRYMRTHMERSCVETRIQSVSRAQEQGKGYAEASPLLIGLEYVTKSEKEQKQQHEQQQSCSSDTDSNGTESTMAQSQSSVQFL